MHRLPYLLPFLDSSERYQRRTSRRLAKQPPKPVKPLDTPSGRVTRSQGLTEALKAVITAQEGQELLTPQLQTARISPIFETNALLIDASHHHDRGFNNSVEGLIEEVTSRFESVSVSTRQTATELALEQHLLDRAQAQQTRVQELSAQYLTLYDSWKAHCATLDVKTQPKPSTSKDAPPPPSARTTRRSAAVYGGMGDMARSDLEMEQILATLETEGATDPSQVCLRNLATIPDMVSTSQHPSNHFFDDTNHLVYDDVEAYYQPTTTFRDWTRDEISVYFERYAAFPKQFGLIADQLPNKTTAECVDFYYMHKKKLIDFRKVIGKYAPKGKKRRKTGRGKGKGILADIRQHDAALGIHGHVGTTKDSQTAPPPPVSASGRPKRATKPRMMASAVSKRPPPSSSAQLVEESSTATPTPEPEKAPKRKRVTHAVLPLVPSPSMSAGQAALTLMRPTLDQTTEEDQPVRDPPPNPRYLTHLSFSGPPNELVVLEDVKSSLWP